MLIALAGLPASGKSSLARRLAVALPATLLDKDSLREFLFGVHVDYRGEQNDLVMDIAYRVSGYLHARQPDIRVLIDGRTFSESTQIATLKQQAQRMNTSLRLIECTCSEESARARLARDADTHLARDRDFDLYLRRRATADPITEPKLALDTDALTLDECETLAIAWLQEQEQEQEQEAGTEPGPRCRHYTDRGQVIVVDIGGTKTRLGQISGGVPCNDVQTIDSQRFNTTDATAALAQTIQEHADARAIRPDAVVIGIPGILDQPLGTIHHCNNLPGLEGSGLHHELEKLLGCRVLLEQDIMLQVLGEWRAGVARGHHSVIGVYFGTGIGSTWLQGGAPRSSPAVCLQAGHIPAGFDGLPCACGNLDCAEAYASGHTLQQLAQQHELPVGELFLQGGVSRSLDDSLTRFVQHQAALLATIVTIANPDIVVVGGGIPAMPGYPRATLTTMARDRLQKPWPGGSDCFGFAGLGEQAPLQGALALLQRGARTEL